MKKIIYLILLLSMPVFAGYNADLIGVVPVNSGSFISPKICLNAQAEHKVGYWQVVCTTGETFSAFYDNDSEVSDASVQKVTVELTELANGDIFKVVPGVQTGEYEVGIAGNDGIGYAFGKSVIFKFEMHRTLNGAQPTVDEVANNNTISENLIQRWVESQGTVPGVNQWAQMTIPYKIEVYTTPEEAFEGGKVLSQADVDVSVTSTFTVRTGNILASFDDINFTPTSTVDTVATLFGSLVIGPLANVFRMITDDLVGAGNDFTSCVGGQWLAVELEGATKILQSSSQVKDSLGVPALVLPFNDEPYSGVVYEPTPIGINQTNPFQYTVHKDNPVMAKLTVEMGTASWSQRPWVLGVHQGNTTSLLKNRITQKNVTVAPVGGTYQIVE